MSSSFCALIGHKTSIYLLAPMRAKSKKGREGGRERGRGKEGKRGRGEVGGGSVTVITQGTLSVAADNT